MVLAFLLPFIAAASAQPVNSPRWLVERALESNQQAKTLEEWKESDFQPELIFEQIANRHSPSQWKELCYALEDLTGSDLALFEDEITDPKPHWNLPCRKRLEKKLSEFWNRNALLTEEDFSLPSRPIYVDPSTTQVFESAGLKEKQIALTFDDGPHPTRTPRILQILKQAGIHATFFEVGEAAKASPETSKLVYESGNNVGSHTYTHPNLTKLSLSEAEDEIRNGRQTVENASGCAAPFFRFPYGAWNPDLKSLMKDLGLSVFFWNMDSLDWKIRDPQALLANVMNEIHTYKGGVILFHDIHEQTVQVLPLVLSELKKEQYTTYYFTTDKSAVATNPTPLP